MVAIPLKEGMSAKEFWQAAAASSDANQARLPQANTWAMQRHLDETAKHVRPGAHAVMLLDNAGWHRTKKLKWPTNISPLFIAAGCPELNAAENVWQHLRQTYLSNRVSKPTMR